MKYKVALVDDEKLFTVGLKMIIESHPDLDVNFIGYNGEDLIKEVTESTFNSDVILLDLSMPRKDGVETLQELSALSRNFKIIILSSFYNEGIIVKLLDEGASGFLAKDADPGKVINTILNIIHKGFHIDDFIMNLLKNRRVYSKKQKLKEALTKRELEVLELICKEYTNKEIADKLYLSKRTIEGHRNRMLDKTGSKNTVGLVLYAVEHSLIDVEITKYA